MNNIELLTDAINRRKPISFEYTSSSDPARGERRGDPYALYLYEGKDKVSTKVDIYQLSGASASHKVNQVKMCDLDKGSRPV